MSTRRSVDSASRNEGVVVSGVKIFGVTGGVEFCVPAVATSLLRK